MALPVPQTIGLNQITITAENADAFTQSPFTLKSQVIKHPGERWQATVTVAPCKASTAEAWVAFLLSMRGRSGVFLLGDPDAVVPMGTLNTYRTIWFLASGVWSELGVWDDSISYDFTGIITGGDLVVFNITIDGTPAIRSSTMTVEGLPPLGVDLFLPGDYIQLGSGATATLHMITAPVDSDSAGKGSIQIWPSLRRNLVDGEAVTYISPVGRFRLANPVFSWQINEVRTYGITFDCVEVV